MKFESKKNTLLEALQLAQSAVPSKTTLQVLNNFLLRLKKNQLEITATDLDLTVLVNIEVEGLKDGAIVINAKKLFEVVKELPDLPVFCSVEDLMMTIKSETGFQCNITGFEDSEYPSLPEEDGKNNLKLSAGALKTLFAKSSFAVSTDLTTRISLTGVLWEHKDKKLQMVGTDGHRLGKAWAEAPNLKINKSIILPPRAISQVLKTVHSDDDELSIDIGESTAKFTNHNVTIFSKLIEGPYPDYEKVIPLELSRTITINREELISALRRVATMANAKTRQVKFSFEGDKLILSAKNQDIGGDSEESIKVEMDGKPISLGFNAGYVLEVLRLMDTENARIKLNSNLGATLFEPDTENAGFFCIVMPLRLLDEG